MVFFLDLNYLDIAVAKRKALLNKCLIHVPRFLNHLTENALKSLIQDAKYRNPWNRVKADDKFLNDTNLNVSEDGSNLVLDCEPCSLVLESFECLQEQGHSSFTDDINFELVCDVVPSSNPSSPECDEQGTADQTSFTSIVQEMFRPESLERFSVYDSCKIDVILTCPEKDAFSEQVQSNHNLLPTNREKLHTDDPFVQANGSPIDEASVFGEISLFCAQCEKPSDIREAKEEDDECDFIEKFVKSQINGSAEEALDEIVVQEELSLNREFSDLRSSLIEIENEDRDIISEGAKLVDSTLSNTLDKVNDLDEKSYQGSEDKSAISFLDVNEIITTELDKFCDKAMLTSPLPLPQEDDSSVSSLVLSKRESIPISLEESRLLDEGQKDVLAEKCFHMERYCDDVQASRLTVPVIQACLKRTDSEDSIGTALGCLHVGPDNQVGLAELELNWSVCEYSLTREVDNTLAKLQSLSSLEGEQMEKEEQKLDPVEVFEKCQLVDLFVDKEQVEQKPAKQSEEKSQNVVKPKDINICTETSGQRNNKLSDKADFDPLGKFMALRSVANNDKISSKKETSKSETQIEDRTKAAHGNQAEPNNVKSGAAIIEGSKTCRTKASSTRKKVKHHVVDVSLTVEFQEILRMFEAKSSSYLDKLKSTGDISSNTTFESLSPDVAQFLIKQRRKYLVDNHINLVQDETYKTLVCLHGLVGAADVLVSCCLESSIAFLAALQEKYRDILNSSLEELRQQLFERKALFSQQQIHHPKVAALCREVEIWLRKKTAKSHDNDQKILILVKRNLPSLLSCLKSALATGHLLIPDILTSSVASHIIENLDTHNCLIGHEQMIQDSFPWSQFSLVVEYDHQEESPWQQLCARQQIRHFALRLKHDNYTSFEVQTVDHSQPTLQDPVYVVTSSRVIKQTSLLQQLEARHNILLIERDYHLFDHLGLCFSDIDVDESTAIIIESTKLLMEAAQVQTLVTRLVALSLKYTFVWILMYPNSSQGYPFTDLAVNNFSRLQAAITNFMAKKKHFKAKVVHCEDLADVAGTVHDIVSTCLSQCPQQYHNDWLDRSWLTEEITLEEKILLTLPPLSSFNAQKLVSKVGLQGSLSKSAVMLRSQFPLLSSHVIQSFIYLTTCDRGLHLKPEDDEEEDQAEHFMNRQLQEALTDHDNMKSKDSEYNEALIVDYKDVRSGTPANEQSKSKSSYVKRKLQLEPLSYNKQGSYSDEPHYQNGWTNLNTFVVEKNASKCVGNSNTSKQMQTQTISCRDDAVAAKMQYCDTVNKAATGQLVRQSRSGQSYEKCILKHDKMPIIGSPSSQYKKESKKKEYQTNQNLQQLMDDSQTLAGQESMPYYGLETLHEANQQHSSMIGPQSCLKGNQIAITFDYNHGLPYIGRETTLEPQIIEPPLNNHHDNMRSQYTNNASNNGNAALKQRIQHLLDTEFPPSEDIDRFEMLPQKAEIYHDGEMETHAHCDNFLIHPKEGTSRTRNRYLQDEVQPNTFVFNPNSDAYQDQFVQQPKSVQIKSHDFLLYDPYKDIASQFASSADNVPNSHITEMKNQGLVINPSLQRLTKRPQFIQKAEEKEHNYMQNLAEQLRETTRKYLENAQQFSKFSRSPRTPHQLNIGLAQPLQRERQDSTTLAEDSVVMSERCRMAQSPWASDSSEPMDLDYDSPSFLEHFNDCHPDEIKQPPVKKRLLTYEKIPRRKGQTRLVFQ